MRNVKKVKRPRRLPSATSATRTLASLLVLGSGLFYLVVAVKGVGWLLAPPPDMVTMARDLGPGTSPADRPWSAGGNTEVLFRPLAVTGAALAALLLLWAGCGGLRHRNDQRRWRRTQIVGLSGLMIGVVGFGVGVATTGSSGYVDASWIGMNPTWPSAALALVVGLIAVALPARRGGRHRPSESHNDDDQNDGQDGARPPENRARNGQHPAGPTSPTSRARPAELRGPLAPAARPTMEARSR